MQGNKTRGQAGGWYRRGLIRPPSEESLATAVRPGGVSGLTNKA